VIRFHTESMKKILTIIGVTATVVLSTVVGAFYEEITLLRQELEQWEESNTADFSEVVARLDDFSTPVFRDVSTDDWYNPYVSSLAEWGIISGYKDGEGNQTGEFRPSNKVTVAEVLKMAMEAAQVDEGNCVQEPLNPYAQSHWALAYVSCAEEMGIRLLQPQMATRLDREARRAEVLSIMHDAFSAEVLPLFSNYSDTAGHYLEADIAYATLTGVVGGDTDEQGNPVGTFRPDDFINRAESAKVIYEGLKAQSVVVQ
jgi:hypothetical protein